MILIKRVEIEGNTKTYILHSNGFIRTKAVEGVAGRSIPSHELTQRPNSNGYLRVNMNLGDGSRNYLVHRLVAENFVPGKTDERCYVNHIDGDKLNNDASNLEWCTRSENEKHAWRTGLKNDTATKGELHGMHKLSSDDVLYIRNIHKRNGGTHSTGELAKMFNVNPQTITDIVSNRIWRCLL